MAQLVYEMMIGAMDLALERNPQATASDCVVILRKTGFDVDRNKVKARIDQCQKQYEKNGGESAYGYKFPELFEENLPRGRKAAMVSREKCRDVFLSALKRAEESVNAEYEKENPQV